jgi:molybdopterin-guanine dinucleotide biosynthesis protein A
MDLETFILIGGRSQRFGSDKALFEFEGEPLASRIARIAQTANPGTVRFVAASETQFGVQSKNLGGPVVTDVRSGLGAWSGMHAALLNSTAKWTLVLACDLPFVTEDLLQKLADLTSDDVDAVVPRQPDGRLQALCAVYRTETTRCLVETLVDSATNPPPLTSILEKLRTRVVSVDCDELRNVNTPADLA